MLIFHCAARGPFALHSAAMSSGSGRERTSQGKSATSQTASEGGSPISAQAKKQKGEGQGGSASTDDERATHSGEHINQFYMQNYSNTFTLENNLEYMSGSLSPRFNFALWHQAHD